MSVIEQEIIDQVGKLDKEAQKRVLEFARSLNFQPGISGNDLIARAHEVNFAMTDLETMQQAIEEGCEQIESEAGNLDPFA